MDNIKLQIELNNHPFNKDVLYVAVSLRGGYITRDFIRYDNTIFTGNYAFYNVLFNYFRIANENVELHYNVQRAASTISFSVMKLEFTNALNRVFDIIFNSKYNKEFFRNAKQKTKDAFSSYYKDGAFRAKYKAYEFSDLNKCFMLKTLINDIEQINFETFIACIKELLVPGNICIYISGETDDIDCRNIKFPENRYGGTQHSIVAGYNFNPYLRQDAHVTSIARKDYNLIIEAFDFMNSEVTNFTKLLIMEVLAKTLPAREIEVWVDSLDANMIISVEKLQSYKRQLITLEKIPFYNAKK